MSTNDGSTNDGSTNDGSTNDGSTNDGSTNDGSTNDGSTNDGSTNDESTNDEPTNSGSAGDVSTGDVSTGDAPHRISGKLPSSLSVYHDFVQQILAKLQELGWDDKILFGVHMALEESISNAIRHGNKEDSQKQVQVDCELSATRFWVKVCDEGEGYEPDAVPDCRSPENLEVPGGRGLALIRAYMTTVEHSECGCCVMMEKLLTAE